MKTALLIAAVTVALLAVVVTVGYVTTSPSGTQPVDPDVRACKAWVGGATVAKVARLTSIHNDPGLYGYARMALASELDGNTTQARKWERMLDLTCEDYVQ